MNKTIRATALWLQLLAAIVAVFYWMPNYKTEYATPLDHDNPEVVAMLYELDESINADRREYNAKVTVRLIVTLALVVVYFVPTHVAVVRRHPHVTPLFIVNLFAAWTLLCWVGTLAWAAFPIKRDGQPPHPAGGN